MPPDAAPAPPALPTLPLGVPGWCLRRWQATDAAAMQRHISHPEVGQYLGDWLPDDYTLAMAQAWVSGGWQALPGRNWAVAHDGQAVGSGGIQPSGDTCNAQIGYWLGRPCWGQGLGTRIVRCLTEQAFADSRVMRVVAHIRPENLASQRVCEKNGFVREGLLRMSALKKGRAVDTVLWAAYRDSWTSPGLRQAPRVPPPACGNKPSAPATRGPGSGA